MPFFESWWDTARVCVSAAGLYAFVVAMVRLLGSRCTAHMNNADWIVTVAIGAIIGKTVLDPHVALADGAAAVATLCGLQFLVTTAASRSAGVRRALVARPRLLYYRGGFLDDALRAERIDRADVLSAVRSAGHASTAAVLAVVLEPSGTLSVVPVPLTGHDEDALSPAMAAVRQSRRT